MKIQTLVFGICYNSRGNMDLSYIKFKKNILIFTLLILGFHNLFLNSMAEAKRRPKKLNNQYQTRIPSQTETEAEEGDDAYDPFADYSEFEYETNEQADVNFFRNGRMLNIGFNGGLNTNTGNLGQKVQTGLKLGFFISYFFDMHFAVQFSYLTGDYPTAFKSPEQTLTGSGNFTTMSFSTKYYTTTQNVTRGFAQLNPYIIFGLANQYKSLVFDNVPGNLKQAALGFDLGAGIEVPMLRKKMFWGLQTTYHFINFKDSARDFTYGGSNFGNQSGSQIDLLGVVGFNF